MKYAQVLKCCVRSGNWASIATLLDESLTKSFCSLLTIWSLACSLHSVFVAKVYGLCLSIAYIAHPRHPYIETTDSLICYIYILSIILMCMWQCLLYVIVCTGADDGRTWKGTSSIEGKHTQTNNGVWRQSGWAVWMTKLTSLRNGEGAFIEDKAVDNSS